MNKKTALKAEWHGNPSIQRTSFIARKDNKGQKTGCDI